MRESTVRDLRAFAAYLTRLPRFFRHPVERESSVARLAGALANREANFLSMIDRAVLSNPRSPYRALLAHAGIERGDIATLVQQGGVEGALARLYDAGVRVTHDEFKGRRPLERRGLSFPVAPSDFDNPLLTAGVSGTTGASRGGGTPVRLDLALLEYRVGYDWLTAEAHGDIDGRPVALWRPVPPGVAGLNNALSLAKRGLRVERWFAQNGLPLRPTREFLLTACTILASRLGPAPLPWPERVPANAAMTVARWIAAKVRANTPPLLNASASSCVRLCLTAQEHGLDIAGTAFRVGGEPFTEAKAAAIRLSGCRALVHYGVTEIGRIGVPCAAPVALDDVHFASDRLAVIQRQRLVAAGMPGVGAFHFTTIHPRSPKILINTESGDYGVIQDRVCGCAIGQTGLTRHLHSIRSYEKLTSEGMHFLGDELIAALEQALPARFGGNAFDYQLVEQEADGLPRVHLVVSPRLGPLDEREIAGAFLEAIGRGPAYRAMMAGLWGQAQTLRVVRAEPYVTAAAKILPLHILHGPDPAARAAAASTTVAEQRRR